MWYLYIIFSASIHKFYTGVTQDDLSWRLERHNLGWGKFTKKGIPWTLVYYESFSTKPEALKREKYIKSMKSSKYIEELLFSAHIN